MANPSPIKTALFAGLLWLAGSRFCDAQNSFEAQVSAIVSELQRQLESLQSNSSDANLRESLSALRVGLEFEPSYRRRFLIPRYSAAAKLSLDKLLKAFATKDASDRFRQELNQLAELFEREAARLESRQQMELAYPYRWRAAGLRSLLPNAAVRKPTEFNEWSQTTALRNFHETPKVFANHPKTMWPAGSYSAVVTTHFEIVSQGGSKPTQELAEWCELAYAVWKQLFFSVWKNKQIDAPEYARPLESKFTIALFRNRDSYIKALRGAETNIGISTGYYDPNSKVAYFYWDGPKTIQTVFHELAHQFFYEANSVAVALDTDRGRGFWVVEALALYMESLSLQPCGGAWVADVGGWDAPRLQAGRYRRLHDEFWIPWPEFHAADGNRIRTGTDIAALYSQATGLAHFWLDGPSDQREQFLAYVQSVYQGRERPELLGVLNDDEALREAYDRFLLLETRSSSRPYFAIRRDAVLSRCKVSSAQLLEWPVEYRTGGWLDLSFTLVDDSLFQNLGTSPWSYERLNLESTSITDESMPAIAAGKSLVELDVSNCSVTDRGIESLRGHKQLKTLWLTRCSVSDESIDVLLSLPQLESIHVGQSSISVAGWERLLRAKPRLKAKSTGPTP